MTTRTSRRSAKIKAKERMKRLLDSDKDCITDQIIQVLAPKRRRLAESKAEIEYNATTSSCDSSGDEEETSVHQKPSYAEEVNLSEYEKKRLRNIQENQAFMASLNLLAAKENLKTTHAHRAPEKLKKKPMDVSLLQPTRRSLRLQNITPEGLHHPLTSCSLQKDVGWGEGPHWPARHPRDPLEMTCLSNGMDGQEKVFREEIARPMAKAAKGVLRVTDRGVLYSKLRLRQVQKVTPKRIYSLEFHPITDKTVVAVGDTHGHLGLWDVEAAAGDHVYLYQPHTRVISDLAFSRPPSAPVLYTCSFDGTLRATDFATGVFSEVYANGEDCDLTLTSCDLTSQSDWLLVSQGDGTVVRVDLRTSRDSVSLWKCHEKCIKSVHLNPTDHNFFVTASNDCTVALWDIRFIGGIRSCIQRVRFGRSVNSAYFSPISGKKILATSMDNNISILQSVVGGPGTACTVLSRRHHNNQTGRWLTGFRARWDPCSDKYFTVGSMCPIRQVEVHSTANSSNAASFVLRDDLLTSVCSLTSVHQVKPVLCGGNSSGRVYYWK